MKGQRLVVLALATTAVLVAGGVVIGTNIRDEKFKPPRTSGSPVIFRIGEAASVDGVVSNLYTYGFIRDQSAFKYALEHGLDTTPSIGSNTLMVGRNTIEKQSDYEVSQTMSAWELAGVLLNRGRFNDCTGGCPPGLFYPELLPGGDLAPSLSEQYEWIKTFDQCKKAGGQLTSEQYFQKTGQPRKCVSPDGREFTDGVEGWNRFSGG